MLLFRIWQSTLFAILMKIPSSEVGGYAILVKPSRTVVDCSADPQEITRKQVFWTDWTRSATNPLCSDTNQKPWILFKGWLLSSLNDPFSLLLLNLIWYRSNRLVTWKDMRENIRESFRSLFLDKYNEKTHYFDATDFVTIIILVFS